MVSTKPNRSPHPNAPPNLELASPQKEEVAYPKRSVQPRQQRQNTSRENERDNNKAEEFPGKKQGEEE